jgi:hypothetical protein
MGFSLGTRTWKKMSVDVYVCVYLLELFGEAKVFGKLE